MTLTLQIEDAATGMTEDALDLIRATTARRVAARINVMVMNFSDDGAWADAMIGAADASVVQLEAPGRAPTRRTSAPGSA